MTYFDRLRIPAASDGAKRADRFMESAADVIQAARELDGWSDQELADAFLHVVTVGAAVGAAIVRAKSDDNSLPQRLRAAQRGVTVVSAELTREVSLRDDEQERQPPELEILMAQARDLHPSLFKDPEYLFESGLELDPASAVGMEMALGQPWDVVFPEEPWTTLAAA